MQAEQGEALPYEPHMFMQESDECVMKATEV